MKNKHLAFLFLIILNQQVNAAHVDTISIFSSSMKKEFKCLVTVPDSYKKKSNNYPCLYILGGLGSSYRGLIATIPALKLYSDQYQMIIVTPDSGLNSWYFDSPVDSTVRFETYISKEVPDYITKTYRTINDRHSRAITGISMGGHGALFLGFRHSSYFGACGSISGALVIEQITPKEYGVVRVLGDTLNKKRYRDYSILGEIDHNHGDSLSLIIDAGTEDLMVIDMNRMVHKKMLDLGIKHDYIERPGSHNTAYWSNSLQYQLFFFNNFFNKKWVKTPENISAASSEKKVVNIAPGDAIDTAKTNTIAKQIIAMYNDDKIENIYNLFNDEKKQKTNKEQFKQTMQQAKSYIGDLSALSLQKVENNTAYYKVSTKNPNLFVYLAIDNFFKIFSISVKP